MLSLSSFRSPPSSSLSSHFPKDGEGPEEDEVLVGNHTPLSSPLPSPSSLDSAPEFSPPPTPEQADLHLPSSRSTTPSPSRGSSIADSSGPSSPLEDPDSTNNNNDDDVGAVDNANDPSNVSECSSSSVVESRVIKKTSPQVKHHRNNKSNNSTKQTRSDPKILPTGCQGVKILAGKFLIFDQVDGSTLHRCVEIETREECVCKVLPIHPTGHSLLTAHYRVEGSSFINPIKEVILGKRMAYIMFNRYCMDLHSYVRAKRRLKEPQARHLFRQIVSAVKEAHLKGIVLRDLKLRKFVFSSDSRLDLKLESLEDGVVLDEPSDDWLSDKHGCPAYVSPEILKCNTRYSGRAADMWGLGVMLYTMLVGRYPFHGQEHSGLFAKIRRGNFNLPDSLSSRAKCLIRCLLRKEPEQRLTTEEVLAHPWLTHLSSRERTKRTAAAIHHLADTNTDHKVPEVKKLKTDLGT